MKGRDREAGTDLRKALRRAAEEDQERGADQQPASNKKRMSDSRNIQRHHQGQRMRKRMRNIAKSRAPQTEKARKPRATGWI